MSKLSLARRIRATQKSQGRMDAKEKSFVRERLSGKRLFHKRDNPSLEEIKTLRLERTRY